MVKKIFGPASDNGYVEASSVLRVSAGDSFLVIPNGKFVLEAGYERLGPDLLLSDSAPGSNRLVVVKDYFVQAQLPDLHTSDGTAVIDGRLASHLSGPTMPGHFGQVQLAQSQSLEQTISLGPSIGEVQQVEGRAFITRVDGTNVQAVKSTEVFVGDIVETESGSNIGIVFSDNTTFALGESGRMVIDDMVYDQGSNAGNSLFNVVKGVFSFVSGEVAKIGDDAMIVKTPVISIGIRGTTVAGNAAAEGSANSVTLLPDADGGVGAIAVSNAAGTQLMSQPFQTAQASSTFSALPTPTVLPASQIQSLYGNITNVLPPKPASKVEQKSDDSDDSSSENTEGEEQGEDEDEASVEEEEQYAEDEEQLAEGEDQLGEGEEQLAEGEGQLGEGGDEPIERGPESEGEGEQLANVEQGSKDEREDRGSVSEEDAQLAESIQNANQDDSNDEEGGPDRYDSARTSFDEAVEAGATKSEAFAAAAASIGGNAEEAAVATEAFNQALDEGVSEQEAVWRAEQAVRAEFDESFNPVEIAAARTSIEQAISEGGSITEAITAQVGEENTSFQDLNIARDAAYQSFDAAHNTGQTDAFTSLVLATSSGSKVDKTFTDILLAGGSIEDAYQGAHEANLKAAVAAGSSAVGGDYNNEAGDSFEQQYGGSGFDYLQYDLYLQGFNPHLKAQGLLQETFTEIEITLAFSENTTANFDETIVGTKEDDVLVGSAGNSSFEFTQGSTLGGDDVIFGGGGTDQVKFDGLDDAIITLDFSADGTAVSKFSNADGSITNTITSTSIEQVFFDAVDAGEGGQPLNIAGDVGLGVVVVGTDGNNTIDLSGDGSSNTDITVGTISVDVDSSNLLGALIFGGDGADTLTAASEITAIFGGSGNDTLNASIADNLLQGGAGNDTFVFTNPDYTKNSLVSGGTNGDGGDTIQLGVAGSSTGQTYILGSETVDDNFEFAGIENLKVFKNDTTVEAFEDSFVRISSIGGVDIDNNGVDDDVTGITLVGANIEINLADVAISSGVSTLKAFPFFGEGVRIFDSKLDSIGRTLIGSDDRDTMSGFGGDDIFAGGAQRDVMSGGDGNDTFQINASTDISNGINVSGGAGTDTLSVNSTSITSLVFSNVDGDETDFATMEKFDLDGGSSDGVAVTMGAFALNKFSIINGNGTTDVLNVDDDGRSESTFDLDGDTLTNIETINLVQTTATKNSLGNDAVDFQIVKITGSTTLTGLTTITGTVDSSSVPDDVIKISGDRDLSGITFTSLDEIDLQDGSSQKQTISASNATSFGLAEIDNFVVGSASTADVFDYTSSLLSGYGTTPSGNLTLSAISSSDLATDVISDDRTAVLDFETSALNVDFTGSSTTLANITDAAEALLESTSSSSNLTGTSSQVTQGVRNTDSLLIFYEAENKGNSADSVIIRYQEGSSAEADFSGELSVFAIFEDVGSGAFDNVNIV